MTFKRSNAAREKDRKQFTNFVIAYLKDKDNAEKSLENGKLKAEVKQKMTRAFKAAQYLIQQRKAGKVRNDRMPQYRPHIKLVISLLDKHADE